MIAVANLCISRTSRFYSAQIGVRSIVINPSVYASVCLCVCLSVREHISGTVDRSLRNFVCRFPVTVVRSSSGGVALRYVLPVFVDDVTFSRNEPYGVGWPA